MYRNTVIYAVCCERKIKIKKLQQQQQRHVKYQYLCSEFNIFPYGVKV